MTKLDAHHESMMAKSDSQLEKKEAAMDVSEERLNKMDTMDLEANREKSETVAEKQGVSREDAAVETTRVLADQYGDQHLDAGSRRQLKKWTLGDGRPWQKLNTA
jgi:hypothetical protein